jgi:hypothetical protein
MMVIFKYYYFYLIFFNIIQFLPVTKMKAAVVTQSSSQHLNNAGMSPDFGDNNNITDDNTTISSPQSTKLNHRKSLTDDMGAINLNQNKSNTNQFSLENSSSQSNLPEEIAIMEIILRFLQLLCENHNPDLQNYLRFQPNNKTSYNLVCETLQFLDCICGSTTGGLGLLGLWINENNVHLINQALESLTEYCQGPCHDNQYAIINHESNGIDIVIALILNDIQPLSKNNLEMFLALKDNASKLLLAVMESNDDTANAERILYNITPKSLIDVIREAFEQGKEMDKQAELNKKNRCNSTSSSQINQAVVEDSTSLQNLASNENLPIDSLSSTTSITPSNTTLPADSEISIPNESNLNKSESNGSTSDIQNNHENKAEPTSDDNESESLNTENESEESEGSAPREVGHNLYILAHKLAKFNKELSVLIKSKDSQENEALAYYAAHTAQIEVIAY